MDEPPKEYKYEHFIYRLSKIIDTPVSLAREKITKIQDKNKYYYYHRKFRRVPTVDQCEIGSQTCLYEANEQFKRDKDVDSEIVSILKERWEECTEYHRLEDSPKRCIHLREKYLEASTNWFVKYGDLGVTGTALDAYWKQKNRLLWERRHGPVGTGMKEGTQLTG